MTRTPLKTATASSHDSRTWHLSFDMGWACIMVCEATGCVSIVSDWLNGNYRWHVGKQALGANSLAEFLTTCDSWYICNKLFHGQHEEVDQEATTTEVRQAILKERRERRICKYQAREFWDEAKPFELGTISTGLWCLLDEPWEYVCHRETGGHRVMREEIVPLLQAEIRASLTTIRSSGIL